MSILRIKELEQQLQRRDARLAEIEAKIRLLPSLPKYDVDMWGRAERTVYGDYFEVEDVLEYFK
jgi:hypothetical protein